MLPIVSAALTVARAMRGLTIPEVAELVELTSWKSWTWRTSWYANPVDVQLIAMVLGVDLSKLS